MFRIGKGLRWRAVGLVFATTVGLSMTAPAGTPAASAATNGNLLVNGHDSAGLCSSSGYEGMTIPGWTITSGAPNVTCYNNTGGFPDASAPGAQPGQGMFTGGTHGNASMTQTADVSAAATAIDAGTASYNLSGWLGAWSKQNDRADVVATFLNATGGPLGTSQIGPVTATDRKNTTEFLYRSASGTIPAGTRTIKVDVNFIWTAGGTTDGYAENLSLTVSPSVPTPVLTAPPSTVPGYDHVFLVYMENENYSATSNTVDGGAGIIGNSSAPYINGLAKANSLLSNYSAVTHNSDPNYVAIAGGSTFGHSAGGNAPTSNCISTCVFNVQASATGSTPRARPGNSTPTAQAATATPPSTATTTPTTCPSTTSPRCATTRATARRTGSRSPRSTTTSLRPPPPRTSRGSPVSFPPNRGALLYAARLAAVVS
jgi:hypothetical protein